IDKNDNTSSPRLETPPDLPAKLLAAVLDLKLLDGGIDGYLKLIEQGLGLASGNGGVPLVGKDLQRGQAFVADVRTKLKAAVGPLATANFTDASDMQTQFQQALETQLGNLLGDLSPTVTAICSGVPCAGGATPDQITGLEFGLTVQRGNPSAGCQ